MIEAAKLDRFVACSSSHSGACSDRWIALSLANALPQRITQVVLDSPFLNMRELDDAPFGRVAPTLAQSDWAVYVQTIYRVLTKSDSDSAGVRDLLAKAAMRWVDARVVRHAGHEVVRSY